MTDLLNEFLKREKFRECLDFAQESGRTFESVVHSYSLKEKIRCGIKSCRTPHNKGFLITASDGLETNVGHCCGKKHLGKNFTLSVKSYESMVQAQANIERIQAFKQRSEATLNRLNKLIEQAKPWQSLSTQLKSNHKTLLRTIKDVHRQSGAFIKNDDKLKENDALSLYKASGSNKPFEQWRNDQDPRVTDLNIRIHGISGIEFDFNKCLIQRIQKPLTLLMKMTPEEMAEESSKKISDYSKLTLQIPRDLEAAEKAISNCQAFFSKENIAKFKYLPQCYREKHPSCRLIYSSTDPSLHMTVVVPSI